LGCSPGRISGSGGRADVALRKKTDAPEGETFPRRIIRTDLKPRGSPPGGAERIGGIPAGLEHGFGPVTI